LASGQRIQGFSHPDRINKKRLLRIFSLSKSRRDFFTRKEVERGFSEVRYCVRRRGEFNEWNFFS
jgi:hypothetical protein